MILLTSMTDITNLITSVGFPIVACGALFWYIVKAQKETTEIIRQNTSVIEKLHGAIAELTERIERIEDYENRD